MSRKRSNYTRYSVMPEKVEEIKNDDPVVEAGQTEESIEPIVMISQVTIPEEEPEIPLPRKASSRKGEVVNCTMVNVRKDTDLNSSILCVLNAGELVDTFEEVNGFYKVMINESIEGFICKDYLSIK